MVELNVRVDLRVAKIFVREREKSAVGMNGDQSWGDRWRLHRRCMKPHHVVGGVGVGYVRNLFNLRKDEVKSKVREWSGVWKEGGGRRTKEGG